MDGVLCLYLALGYCWLFGQYFINTLLISSNCMCVYFVYTGIKVQLLVLAFADL